MITQGDFEWFGEFTINMCVEKENCMYNDENTSDKRKIYDKRLCL